MNRRAFVVGVLLVVVVITITAIFLIRKHQNDVLAAAARAEAIAKYQRLRDINDKTSAAIDRFSDIETEYATTQSDATQAGQQRHDLFAQNSIDYADALTDVRKEKSDVEQLQTLAQQKDDAARDVATALGSYFGEGTASSLLSDINNASEAEGKYLADWWRASSQINDSLTAEVNGRWYSAGSDEIESLYRTSDEEGAVSRSRWGTVDAKVADLHDRLRQEIASAQSQSGSVVPSAQAQSSSSEPSDASTVATSAPAAIAQSIAPTSSQNLPEVTRRDEESSPSPDSPLKASNVLPLLRATAALSVSTQSNGATAYVTVPDTPAQGTVDPNRIISGRLADGRWVVFVPLASGSPSVGDIYSLMWVWTDGRAQFVGEIPAENNGLGQLSTSVRNGEIYISWPICCPRATRIKVLTLDGIRLRPLSDTSS